MNAYSDAPNPFEAHAETLRPLRGSAEHRAEKAAQAKGEREATPLARKRKEKAELSKRWRKARREEWRMHAGGDYGPAMVEFRKALKRLVAKEASPDAFIAFVGGETWLRNLPRAPRAVARGLVTDAVIRIRAGAGYEFIDDSLPGEPPTVLERCHALIGRA